MLVQFSVDNHLSFKDRIEFSMVSGSNNDQHVFAARSLKLLSSAVLYGANASGKSNLLRAFGFMQDVVLNRSKVLQSTDRLAYRPFRLSTETEAASSSFEVIFIQNDVKYRYGFEADAAVVYEEWLFADEKGKEAKLFYRENYQDNHKAKQLYVNTAKFKEGVGLKVLDNCLFLWKCDQESGPIAQQVLFWFRNTNVLPGNRSAAYRGLALHQLERPEYKEQILQLLQRADLGIQGLRLEEQRISTNEFDTQFLAVIAKGMRNIAKENSPDSSDEEPNLKEVHIRTVHDKFDEHGQALAKEEFDLHQDESLGTQKFFDLAGPLLDTLAKGRILFVDEIDASLHPFLTMALLSLFHDQRINKHKAQLIFTSHDTNLLNSELFHKSQIWFTEKDTFGSTHLHSLVEYKNIRPTDNFQKHYLQGKYGAIPYIGELSFTDAKLTAEAGG